MKIKDFAYWLGRDVRHALRRLAARPAFTVTAVLTLAVGIGATTAIFSVVNAVLIKPLAYPNADELVSLQHTTRRLGADELLVSPTMYFTYRDEATTFQQIGLWEAFGQSITGIGEPEQARALFVTHGTLQALGVQPMLGRWFSEGDDTPGADGPLPVILSHAYWQRRFGGDEAAVGRTLSVGGRSSQVVAVMPEGFRFLNVLPQVEIILPMRLDRTRLFLGNFTLRGVARLKPGVTPAEANAEIERILPIWLAAWPVASGGPVTREDFESLGIAPVLEPLKDDLVGSVANMLWVLMGTIGAVLVIACMNVANLMLVRADTRRQEFAVRSALGAKPAQVARDVLIESLVLGAAGGILGLPLAYAGVDLLVVFGPADLPRLAEISIDPFVLAFTAAASLVSSVLFGSLPALKSATRIASLSGGRGASASREQHRTRNALIVVQVALALALIVSSGLMIRTFQALQDVDPGFTNAAEIQTARISSGDLKRERVTELQRAILDKIVAIPGVTAAGFTSFLPMEGRADTDPVFAQDRAYQPGETSPLRRFKFISPGYFEAMGTRIVAGRDVTWTDIERLTPVAVISESLARELWGETASALGKRIRESRPDAPGLWREVVGVVQDVHEDALHQPPPMTVYWPVAMESFRGNASFRTGPIAFAIRSERSGTESLVNEIRQAVWSVNSDLAVFFVRTMQDLYADSLARTSFTLVMLAIAGGIALALGIIGIYGVIAYVVSQRAREIGIRSALGAEPRQLKRMFLVYGMMLSGAGVLVGLVVAAALSRSMSSLLFGIEPMDPAAYIAAIGVILAATAIATYVPARRAAAIEPIDILRAE
jgi:putative ABC transport system permease protein